VANDPVMFTAEAARRIAAATVRTELTPRRSSARPKRAAQWTYSHARGKVTTAIPSGTFDSPSETGEVQIYHKDATGAWRPRGDPVKVFNQFKGDPVSVGVAVLLGWIAGDWWLVAADCEDS